MGHAVGRPEEAVRPPGRGVRGLHRLYRLRDRPRDPAGRGHGPARQHADHLHRRRQRHQPRRHAVRHAQPVHLVQRHPRFPDRGAAQVLRRLGLGRDATRTWRSRGRGRSTRRSSGPSRSRRTSAARARVWRSRGPTASRTPAACAHQFHHIIDIVPTILEATGIKAPQMVDGIKQKPIEGVSMAYTFDKANAERALEAQDPVLRDDRQPRHLPRRLVRQHDAAARAVDPERALARRRRTTSGSCTT